MKSTLASNDVKSLLTLPNEVLVTAKRQHYFVLITKLGGIIFISGLLLVGLWLTYYVLKIRLELQLAGYLLLFSLGVNFITKTIVDWYFHIYLVTNRKIVEIAAVPFYSDIVNDVFLDQVRTTEVDANVNNFIEEILNLGDVTIAFDRPSHDELFVMRSIADPCETAMKLGDALEVVMHSSPVWFKREAYPDQVRFSEDIYQDKLAVN